jgi:hypothetical protein
MTVPAAGERPWVWNASGGGNSPRPLEYRKAVAERIKNELRPTLQERLGGCFTGGSYPMDTDKRAARPCGCIPFRSPNRSLSSPTA